MKKILLTLATVACLTSHAQIAQVNSVEPLLRGVESEMYYPELSQDGTKLLFTSVNYKGLKMYDFNNDVTVKITDSERAGLDAKFSADGNDVYFVSQTNLNGNKVLQSKMYNVALNKENEILSSRKMGGTVSVRVQGSSLFIANNGVEKAYSPVEKSAGYLWVSLSPDKTKVMFFAAGKGIIITDLNGNIISELGNYESPVWFGNSHVVAMNAKHNGYQNIASQIIMMDVEGTQMQELTKPESMTMNPTASFEAGKIVYNTIDGRLYQMNISLK